MDKYTNYNKYTAVEIMEMKIRSYKDGRTDGLLIGLSIGMALIIIVVIILTWIT